MAVDASAGQRRLPSRIRAGHRRQAEAVATAAKVLADPVRVQILGLLRDADRDVCQCELQPLFSLSQPTMSHHLHKLAEAGMVEVERRGKWVYYSIDDAAMGVLRSWLS